MRHNFRADGIFQPAITWDDPRAVVLLYPKNYLAFSCILFRLIIAASASTNMGTSANDPATVRVRITNYI